MLRSRLIHHKLLHYQKKRDKPLTEFLPFIHYVFSYGECKYLDLWTLEIHVILFGVIFPNSDQQINKGEVADTPNTGPGCLFTCVYFI